MLAKVIVGLGNPGDRYARNRHNAGFLAVEALARESAGRWSTYRLARTCRMELAGRPVLLAMPWTYMNESGRAVSALLSALEQSAGDLLLVFDDLSLPFGRIRVRERGSAGGHRGLESVMTALDTDAIARVRMGIGEQEMPRDKADFVLADFPPERETDLQAMISRAGNAVKSILTDGVSQAMALYNAS